MNGGKSALVGNAMRGMFAHVPGLNRVAKWATTNTHPTIFHITHHKAGSQWINRILHALAYDRIVPAESDNTQFLARPVVSGKVYPTLYVTREQFQSVPVPANSYRFGIIRDLRDTLVSLYYSLRYSHVIMNERMRAKREMLNGMSNEEGLLEVLRGDSFSLQAQLQWSWIVAREELIKYEDLLSNDEKILTDILFRRCRLGVDPVQFRDIIRANRFEAKSGRKPGEADHNSHERKGVSGDWRNQFSPTVIAEFKRLYGSVLIATGYEKDFNW